MKLYHTTYKHIYDNYIKIYGLKPICDIKGKQFAHCGENIYFTDNIEEAIDYGWLLIDNLFDQKDIDIEPIFVTLEVDIRDVLNVCKWVGKGTEFSDHEYIATSKINDIDFTTYDNINFPCIISPDKLSVVYTEEFKKQIN